MTSYYVGTYMYVSIVVWPKYSHFVIMLMGCDLLSQTRQEFCAIVFISLLALKRQIITIKLQLS